MEPGADKSSSGINVKSWQWSIMLFLFMLAYLVLGAFIFDATETQNSINAQTHLYEQIIKYYSERPCLGFDFDVMGQFGENMTHYLSRGASLKKEHWIDSEEDTVETIWVLSRASIFTLTIVTTIGYGNIVPRTTRGKLFCVLYALVGIPLMGFTLSIFGKSLDGFIKRYEKAIDLLKRPIKSTRPRLIVQTIMTVMLVFAAVVFIPASLLAYFEAWPYFDAIYFFFITISTVGLGDIILDGCVRCHQNVWIFVILFVFYVFLGMCIITALFKVFTTYQRRKFMEAETLIVTFLNTASSTIINTASHDADGNVVASNSRETVDQATNDSFDSGTGDHDILTVEIHTVHGQNPTYTFVEAKR